MKDKLFVWVTEDHIKAGKRGDVQGCPIALAVQDELGEGRGVQVIKTDVKIEQSKEEAKGRAANWVTFEDPLSDLNAFVTGFDAGKVPDTLRKGFCLILMSNEDQQSIESQPQPVKSQPRHLCKKGVLNVDEDQELFEEDSQEFVENYLQRGGK